MLVRADQAKGQTRSSFECEFELLKRNFVFWLELQLDVPKAPGWQEPQCFLAFFMNVNMQQMNKVQGPL